MNNLKRNIFTSSSLMYILVCGTVLQIMSICNTKPFIMIPTQEIHLYL